MIAFAAVLASLVLVQAGSDASRRRPVLASWLASGRLIATLIAAAALVTAFGRILAA